MCAVEPGERLPGDERWYTCANCGARLFRSTVPLGAGGGIDIKCRDRRCRWTTFVLVGREPPPPVDHQAWLERYLRFGAQKSPAPVNG